MTRKPEPFEVDAALEQMEWQAEKERTRKALAYVNAHRKPVVITRAGLLKFYVGAVLLLGAALFGFLVAIEKVLEAVGY